MTMAQKPNPASRRSALREAVRREEQSRRRRKLLFRGSAIVGVLAVIVAIALLATRPGATPVALSGLVTYPNEAAGHVSGTVTYDATPPVGGDHAAVWQNCGIYTEPVANENVVHSLEHGAMWITYSPDLPADQVTALQDTLRNQPYGLLSPYPDLPAPVVASAWGVQLKLTSATDPRLAEFIAAYGDGSKAPEPKGECTGGTGTPQG